MRTVGLAAVVDRGNLIRIDPSVYFVDHIPVHVEALDVALIVVASLVLAIVATLPPSRGAARLEPVDAIRHE